MKRLKAAGVIAALGVAGWLAVVAVAIWVMVKGGRLIEEGQAEWPD